MHPDSRAPVEPPSGMDGTRPRTRPLRLLSVRVPTYRGAPEQPGLIQPMSSAVRRSSDRPTWGCRHPWAQWSGCTGRPPASTSSRSTQPTQSTSFRAHPAPETAISRMSDTRCGSGPGWCTKPARRQVWARLDPRPASAARWRPDARSRLAASACNLCSAGQPSKSRWTITGGMEMDAGRALSLALTNA